MGALADLYRETMRPIWELPLDPAGMLFELSSGARVRIRPVRATDKAGLQEAFLRLSEQSRYYRFFSARPSLPDGMATSLTEIDHRKHVAWAVFDPDAPLPSSLEHEADAADGGLAVGVARIIADDDDPETAEAALSVVDDYQRMGIGRFLIELILATAGQFGVKTLRFTVLAENRGMRRLLPSLGASAQSVPGDASIIEYLMTVPSIDDTELPAGALYELLRLVSRPDETPAPDGAKGPGSCDTG